MKKYKLTDQNMQTHNGFQWKLGEERVTSGNGKTLCNASWLHYYHSPLLAVLLNPIHADIKKPRLFEIKALGKHLDDRGLKGGCNKMTLVKELKLPEIMLNQKIAFSILCSLEVYKEPNFVLWANNWLNGIDRSYADAADAAANAAADADAAAYAAAYAAARAAADAADAADAYVIDFIKIAKKALTYK